MAINLNDNLEVNAPKPTDARYGVYADTATALTAVPSAKRYQGLTVGVLVSGAIVEYWFKDGIADLDLVEKTSGGSGAEWGAITGTLSSQTDLQSALDDKQDQDNLLDSISGLSGNGIIVRQNSNDAVNREIVAGSSKITVANGDGTSGNPSIDVAVANLIDDTTSTTSNIYSASKVNSLINTFALDSTASSKTVSWNTILEVNVLISNITITLDSVVGNTGKLIFIKNSNTNGNFYTTIAAASGQSIDGNSSIKLNEGTADIVIFAKDATQAISFLRNEEPAIIEGRSPTVNDDESLGFSLGQIWVDNSTSKFYIALSLSAGSAIWQEINEPSLLMSAASVSSNTNASYGSNYLCDSTSPFTVTSPNPSGNNGKFFRVSNFTGEESIEVVEFGGSSTIVNLEPTESCVIFSNGTENALFSICPVKAVDMSWAFDYVETSDDNYNASNGELINFSMSGATGNKNLNLPALGGPSDIKPVIVAVTGISNYNLIVNAPEGGIIQRAASSVIMVPKQIMTFLPTLENELNYIIKDSDLSQNATIARLISGSFDTDDFRDNINAISKDINGLTNKTTPVGADELIISDSEALNVLKKIAISSLPSGSGSWTHFGTYTPGSVATFDISDIPAGVNFIKILVNNLSCNVNNYVKIRFGDSSGISSASYVGNATFHWPLVTAGSLIMSDSFYVDCQGAASDIRCGILNFARQNGSDEWIMSGANFNNTLAVYSLAGGKSAGLVSDLTTIRIFTTTGTFDSGTFDVYIA